MLPTSSAIFIDEVGHGGAVSVGDQQCDPFGIPCDHRVMIAHEDLHPHAAENLAQADALTLASKSWRPGGGRWRGWGTLRPDDRRSKEVCRVEYPGPGRLERGDRERGSAGECHSAAEAAVGHGIVRGRRELALALAEYGRMRVAVAGASRIREGSHLLSQNGVHLRTRLLPDGT